MREMYNRFIANPDGIEPMPNINEKISAMIQKYRAETIDIQDAEFEEVDLEFDSLPLTKYQHRTPIIPMMIPAN